MTTTTSPASSSVEFRGVSKTFGATRALDDLNLCVAAGELLALLGPSGCGKTTALRMLAGFETPDSGVIEVGGVDVSHTPVNRRDMGMVFQAYSLFPNLSAADNVAFGPRVRKQAAAARRKRALELLEIVGLHEHAAKFPHQLSGGQQQRVALARALAIEPKVLLLDEPLSALDAKVRSQLRDEIRRVQTELGVTTVFVTHDQDEALSMADRVGVMRAGRLEGCATPAELYHRPPTPFVAEFVGAMNRLPGLVEAGRVRVLEQSLPIDGQPPTGACEVVALVRPEAVDLGVVGGIPATIEQVTFFGASARVKCQTANGTTVLADVSSYRAAEFPVAACTTVQIADRPVLVQATDRDRAASSSAG